MGAKPPPEAGRQSAGKNEGGWGEGIFALLRLELERFRFPLIKRKPKQKIFHILLKDKVNCEAREGALGYIKTLFESCATRSDCFYVLMFL